MPRTGSTPVPPPAPSLSALLVHSGFALGLSQRLLGELLGVSRSTMNRWQGQSAGPLLPSQVETLARALYPVNPELASQVAGHHGVTLASMGLGIVPHTAAPAADAAMVPHALAVDTVVCAAADALGQAPAAVRPVVVAAFERAMAAGLSVGDVVKGLRAGATAKASKG